MEKRNGHVSRHTLRLMVVTRSHPLMLVSIIEQGVLRARLQQNAWFGETAQSRLLVGKCAPGLRQVYST